jgi:hypothetical protein
LDSHVKGIIYGAWLKGFQVEKNSTSVLGNVTVLVGPNTHEDDPNSLSSLKLASALYANFPQVKNLYVIKFSESDISWAQQKYDQLHPINWQANAAENQCSGTNGCDGGSAGVTSQGDGLILLGQGGTYRNQPILESGNRATSGQVIAHEYTHTVQQLNSQSTSISGSFLYGKLPQWLLEGNAEWSATVARYNDSYSDYVKFRGPSNGDLGDQYANSAIYTANWISKYLNPNPTFPDQDDWSYWEQYPRWDAYAIGFMVNEILADVKSPGAIMSLYKDVGNGMTFTDAFQQEFGMAWSDACPLIAKAISEEIQQGISQ